MVSLDISSSTLRAERDPLSAEPKPFWSRIVRQERLVWIGAGTLAACLVGLGVLVFVAMGDRQGHALPASEVPLITADEKPYKVRPEDPGGLDVPDRDKLVYEQMRGAENVVVVERLLTEPERPLQPPLPPQVFTEDHASAPDDVAGIDTNAIVEPARQADHVQETPTAADSSRDSRAQAAAAKSGVLEIPAPKARPQAPAVKTAQLPVAAQTGRYHVQLLAVRSSSAAMDEWQRLSAKNSDALAGLSPHVSRLDRGQQSPFFA